MIQWGERLAALAPEIGKREQAMRASKQVPQVSLQMDLERAFRRVALRP